MRLILMGTGPFAVPTFRSLLASRHTVAGLVTRPVPPARGRQQGPANPVFDACAASGLPVIAPADVNDAATREELSRWRPELFVVCDYGQILAHETLGIASRGGINLHASLLPKYRGAAPINWAIWCGETETGVTVIHMTPRLDGGPCLTCACTAIKPEEDAPALERRLSDLGVEPVLDAIDLLEHWDGQTSLGTPQDPARATRAPRLRKSHGEVDWTNPAARIVNQVRALRPWPGTYTYWRHGAEPMRLILERVAVEPHVTGAEPGCVTYVDRQTLVIATGDGGLVVEQIQPAGKRVMHTSEFLRGHPVRVGDRWGAGC